MTADRKTYFNAYPLNGQNRKSSVSCPLQIFFKTVNITVRFKRRSDRTKSLPVSQSSVSVSRWHQNVRALVVFVRMTGRGVRKKSPLVKGIIAIHFGQKFHCTVN